MEISPDLLHGLHRFCALYMTGIIWFVQLVQYPMLHLTCTKENAEGHQEYTRRMGLAVGPVMLAELALQLEWVVRSPDAFSLACGLLLFIIWASTIFLQVPCHRDLETAFDPETQQELVRSNWIRTLAWTARALLLNF